MFWPVPPLALPDSAPWELPSEKLQAIVYFKEESHALVEQVLHLYSQGFSNIRLIDNNSQQHELPVTILKAFEKQGVVTLKKDYRVRGQKRAYMTHFQYLRRYSDWIMPVDADEFPRTTKFASLLNYLVLKDDEICTIAIPMMFFGSSDRAEQPNSILQGFTHRRNFEKRDEPILGYKTISRPRCALWTAIHHTAVPPSLKDRSYNSHHGFTRERQPKTDGSDEQDFPDAVVNHYRTQSEHYYRNNKLVRGSAISNKKHPRTMQNYHEDNKLDNELEDRQAATSAQQRFPALYRDKSLVLKSNQDLNNPWPLENAVEALEQLARHQGLCILDASIHGGFPEYQFGKVLRNSALLDPTWDCIVRVPPGYVKTIVGSGLTKLCATKEKIQDQDFERFVESTVKEYSQRYSAFVAMDSNVLLNPGSDTAQLREDAKQLDGTSEIKWKDWIPKDQSYLESGVVRLVPKSFTATSQSVLSR